MKPGTNIDTAIRRRRLEQAWHHRGLIVVESPPGFDADLFRDDLYALARANGVDVIHLDDPDDIDANRAPGLAVIDAPLAKGLRGWRDTVIARHRDGRATVVALPAGISGDVLAEEPVPTVLVDAYQLRMSGGDVVAAAAAADIGVSDGVADLIASLGDGWPAWVRACLGAAGGDRVDLAIDTITSAPFRRRLVRSYLHGFTDTQRFHLAQLAHFAAFTDNAATAIGGFGFTETVLPHAPGLYRDPAGRYRFVTPVDIELTSEFGLDPAIAEALAPVLAADGQVLPATQILIRAGLDTSAARFLESLPGRILDHSNQRELIAILRVLQPQFNDHPGLSLKLARAHGNLAEIAASVASCEQVVAQVTVPDPIRLEATIELLMYRHRTISQPEAAQRIADLHGQVDHLGGPLPTRLREIEAQILGQASDNATVSVAADRFTEVAAEWEVQQERLRAAKTLRGLASGPLYHLGRYRHGQERLAHASQLAVTQSFDYGITVGLKARFDALCGDLDAYEHSVALAQPVITESGIGWLEGSLQWAAAHAAGWRHDAAGVDRAFRNAQHMLGGLYDTDTGVVLAAEVATIFAALGQHDRARRCLAAIADRADQNRMEYRLAELIVTARAGGLDQAVLLWHDLDRSGIVPVDRRWRAQLELIAAGWAGSGTPTVADIEAEAARLGLADLPSRLAPALFDHDAAMHIHLLGRFAITTTEGELDLPTGQVPELVKLLAVHDGQMTIDAVCDSLWPDADIKLGLRRLKNLVAKTRHHLGNDALIRRPDTLALASNITTDIAEFTRASNDSVARQRNDAEAARRSAVTALDSYDGHLLPDDIYNDRINQRRRQLHLDAVRLLDLLSDAPAAQAPWLADTRRRVHAEDPATR